jgi:S1-C subfamily serine protease
MSKESLTALDQSLTDAVSAAGPSVVRVSGRRHAASGMVFREPDLVVTASHAIRRDGDLRITTADGDVHDAELVGRHRGTDLALLRVTDAELKPIAFRGVDDLATGNLTLALARPGRAIRASLRIVGVIADEMSTPFGGHLDKYIETDRGLPHGFAGGPLVDLEGRAIGMNTDAILRGADLAIPKKTLDRVVDAILADGGVKRGYLGVAVRPVRLPEDVAEDTGQHRGALVLDVEKGSAADASGLVLGDVLMGLGADPITGPRSLSAALRDRVNAEVEATLLRGGAKETITLKTGARL